MPADDPVAVDWVGEGGSPEPALGALGLFHPIPGAAILPLGPEAPEHLIVAGQRGSGGASADIDEDLLGFEELIADTYVMRVFKARVALVDRQILSALQPLLYAFVGAANHSVFARFDFLHVDSD